MSASVCVCACVKKEISGTTFQKNTPTAYKPSPTRIQKHNCLWNFYECVSVLWRKECMRQPSTNVMVVHKLTSSLKLTKDNPTLRMWRVKQDKHKLNKASAFLCFLFLFHFSFVICFLSIYEQRNPVLIIWKSTHARYEKMLTASLAKQGYKGVANKRHKRADLS